MSNDRAMLVVGHGTRSESGVAQFCSFINRLEKRADAPYPATAGGFIELSDPSVTDAVDELTGRGGHRSLVAVPLVLVAAGHGKGDIPAALRREQERHRSMTFVYGRPLGPHPTLNDAVEARIDDALGTDERATTHVLLVGRGSTDPDANAEIVKIARLLWEGRGYAGVEPAFISLAEPGVPAGIDKLRRLGARRIVVAPYFLFPGVLPDRIVEQSLAFAAGHADLDIRVADLIGDCDELADLVLERYREALHGDIRMNCDTCLYRIALPGHADRVGAPQRPHHHPADEKHGHTHDHHHGGHDHHGHAT